MKPTGAKSVYIGRMRLWSAIALVLVGCSTEQVETPREPLTTSGSLAEQQAEHGWGTDQCPALPTNVASGFLVGDQLGELVLKDCDGADVDLRELCGADVLWLSIAHAWCPHCRENGANMERMRNELAEDGDGIAAISILIDGNELGTPATAELCTGWRAQFGQDLVLTLFDPDERSMQLFERSVTALNVVIDRNRVIRDKLHTDVEEDILAAINAVL
jgi:hypothetical protein